MSFSLEIVNGDLNISSGQFEPVRGIEKLRQDLGLWLRERYGIDRFHPNYGSTLDTYVGNVIDDLSMQEIEQEVIRVCSVYQQLQILSLKSDPSKYTTDELLDSVVSVDCTQDYDKIDISLRFRTASGTQSQISERVMV